MRIRFALAIFLMVGFVLLVPPGFGKEPADSLDGPPLTTAASWAIADFKTGKLLWSHNPSATRQMASTTKIMTAWIVLDLAAADPKVLEETVTITERADKTGGSTANVVAGERIAVAELLYGLLLPSGNDAAVALAEHFGDRLRPSNVAGADDNVVQPAAVADDALALFVAEMNRRAEKLGMDQTSYLDPHGFSNNRSSADDLVLLALQAMQNERFRRYVSTTEYTATFVAADATERKSTWKNFNQLLDIEGFDGVKTGTTGGAGECLVSSGHRGDDHLLVVVLGASSGGGRYVDSRNLYRWAWSQRAGGK
jgi:D-alanyl-D-alanine carboxypeptidase (penicillin-binding protein 5/6)